MTIDHGSDVTGQPRTTPKLVDTRSRVERIQPVAHSPAIVLGMARHQLVAQAPGVTHLDA